MLYESKVRWDAKHTRVITMKLNTGTDADILARLDAEPKEAGGKQGYIKRLIRADIASHEKGGDTVELGGFDYITASSNRLSAVLAYLEQEASKRNFYTDNGRFREDICRYRLYMDDRQHYEDDPWRIIKILRERLGK